jgi:hypothetical protein
MRTLVPTLGVVGIALLYARPAQAALSCATPCTASFESTDGAFYSLYVSCESGAYSAATGASHSSTTAAGSPQNVIYGGSSQSAGTSQLSFYLHGSSEHFSTSANGTLPADATSVTPTGVCVFDPPDTAAEPSSTGIEAEFTVTTAGGEVLTWRHEVVTFGDTEEESGIRLTQTLTRDGAATGDLDAGLRWQIDYQSASDDGPVFAHVECDPFDVGTEQLTEQAFAAADIGDFYRMVNNVGTPEVETFTSTAPLAGHDATGKPDQLLFGDWRFLNAADWDYAADASHDPDSDSAVLYGFGVDAADATTLAPGAAVSHSVVLFGGVGAEDCGEFTPTDTGDPDTGDPDTGPTDTGPTDTGPTDTGPTDTGPDDTGPADTAPTDSGPDDTAPTDTAQPHIAGGLAGCGDAGKSAGLFFLLLTTGLATRRRRS